MNTTSTEKASTTIVPQMRYIADAVKLLKTADPETPVTVYMVTRLVKTGAIPSTPIGRRRLVDVAQLCEYLAHPIEAQPEQRGGIRRIAP